jgi:hypothetical protein
MIEFSRRFGGTPCLSIRSGRVGQRNSQEEAGDEYLLLGSFFDPESGSSKFLRNVFELPPDYLASHFRK